MAKALIIVDMQTDFISGTLGSKEASAIVNNVKERAEKLVADKAALEVMKSCQINVVEGE